VFILKAVNLIDPSVLNLRTFRWPPPDSAVGWTPPESEDRDLIGWPDVKEREFWIMRVDEGARGLGAGKGRVSRERWRGLPKKMQGLFCTAKALLVTLRLRIAYYHLVSNGISSVGLLVFYRGSDCSNESVSRETLFEFSLYSLDGSFPGLPTSRLKLRKVFIIECYSPRYFQTGFALRYTLPTEWGLTGLSASTHDTRRVGADKLCASSSRNIDMLCMSEL
jgi:hypothetical protein